MLRWLAAFALTLFAGVGFDAAFSQSRFTVADDIAIGVFGDNSYMGRVEAITWSPDHKLVAVHVGRGRLSSNSVESELRIYTASGIVAAINGHRGDTAPVRRLVLNSSEGPVIRTIKWTRASDGVAFLARLPSGVLQLRYLNAASGEVETLSRPDQDVFGYTLVDRWHFVIAVRELPKEATGIGIVTGRSLLELAFSQRYTQSTFREVFDRASLWRSSGSAIFPILDSISHQPVIVFREGAESLSLSPDQRHLLLAEPVARIPAAWIQWIPGEKMSSVGQSTHPQDLSAARGPRLIQHYVLRDLVDGSLVPVGDGPTGRSVGWFTNAPASWSDDGHSVIFASLFVKGSSPCIALHRIAVNTTECLVNLRRSRSPEQFGTVAADKVASFGFYAPDRPYVTVKTVTSRPGMELHFNRSAIGNWSQKTATPRSTQADLEIAQDLKSPPVLVAKANGKSRSTPIWNPNAGLDWAKIGPVELFEAVTDRNERVAGGLYLPPGYNPTKRYPLVIQNHGFNSYEFVPSGVYPTSFAARELASVGIVVLQLKDCPERGSTDEGDCQLRAYRTAIATLARRGLIDPDRVGIIGFSRTCYYVLKALYAAGLSFRAASITDGIDAGYWQYMMSADDGQNIVAGDAASLIGANPWGEGLRVWAALSPAFNTDKMTTPLQIVATNDYSLLSMWQAYAALRYQRKPVELVKLDTDEHVLTNPATRLMSQGGTVDWMRFWLQDYEDPDPAKTGQYTQWRAMRRLDSR